MSLLRPILRLYAPFLDPVFVKDLEGLSRRWRLYVGRMLYVGLVAIILVAFLNSIRDFVSTSRFANLGRDLFTALVTLQMIAVSVGTAHLASDLLLREARSGTLQLMLLTPLSGWRIVQGKWKAAMAQASTLILAGAPPLAITAYLGGAGPEDLLWSATISFALAALSSSLALFCALTSRTAVRATIMATAAILVTGLVLGLASMALFFTIRSSEVAFVLSFLHPVVRAVVAANPATFGEPAAHAWIGAALLSILASQVFLMSTAGHLSISSSLDELLAPRGLATSEQGPGLPSLESRAVWQTHPLLWREIACQTISRIGWTRRTSLAAFLPLWLWTAGAALQRGESTVLGGWLLVLTGLAMAAGAELFIRDKEGRHLDVLFTLPVSDGQLVGAKLLSRILTLEGAAFLIWMILMLEWNLGKRSPFLVQSAPVLSFVLFSYVLAAVASLYAKTQRGAFLLAASVVWSGILGLPVLKELLPAGVLLEVHPTVLGEALLGEPGGGAAWPASVVFVLVYGAATASLIFLMVRRFRRQLD